MPLFPYRQHGSREIIQAKSKSDQHQVRQFKVTKVWQWKLSVDTISGGHSRAVYAVAFSPDAQTLPVAVETEPSRFGER